MEVLAMWWGWLEPGAAADEVRCCNEWFYGFLSTQDGYQLLHGEYCELASWGIVYGHERPQVTV